MLSRRVLTSNWAHFITDNNRGPLACQTLFSGVWAADEDKSPLNNNRNNRRRGRGNRNNQGGGGNQLNRIDSRARGNAPQLLDKYKKLAQDAQHNGDRVQAEYYLQFADHYFRVIADNKARQDEARAKRNEGREPSDEEGEGSEDGDNRRNEGRSEGRNEGRGDNRRGNTRRNRGRRDDAHDEHSDNGSSGDVVSDEGEMGVEGEAIDSEGEAPKPKRRARKPKADDADGDAPRKPRTRRTRSKPDDSEAGGLDSSVLPPAIGSDDGDDSVEAAA